MVLAYIICKDKSEAEKISLHLLRKKLIACSNMFPICSMYWWNFRIEHKQEYAILAKTNNKAFNKAVSEVKRVHSYKIPCILRIEAKANKEYEEWADKGIGRK